MFLRKVNVALSLSLFLFVVKCHGDDGSNAKTPITSKGTFISDGEGESIVSKSPTSQRSLQLLGAFKGLCPDAPKCGRRNRGTRIHRYRLGGTVCVPGCALPRARVTAVWSSFECGACPNATTTTSVPTKAPVMATSKAPVTATSKAPVTATSKAPVMATSKAPVMATSKTPVIATPKAPVAASTMAPFAAPLQPPVNSAAPVRTPTAAPFSTPQPSIKPNGAPTIPRPSTKPTVKPSAVPSVPTRHPTKQPTRHPTTHPTRHPTKQPTRHPTKQPTRQPTKQPTVQPTKAPRNPGPYIHNFQGNGSTNVAQNVSGIVTAALQYDDERYGFYLQEEDADQDVNSSTSEGIFVLCKGRCTPEVSTGDQVTVTGPAFGSAVDVRTNPATYTVVSNGNPLPTPVSITFPAQGSTRVNATFQHLESMIVTFPQSLVVVDHTGLNSFGLLSLSAESRPIHFTQLNSPSISGFASYLDFISKNTIALDDTEVRNFDAVSSTAYNEVYFYPEGGLSLTNKFRAGDTISVLTGVLDNIGGYWRVRPIPSAYNYTFSPTNPSPPSPEPVGGNLKVACVNAYRYFTTLDTNTLVCGPGGTSLCLGANTAAELARQRSKIVSALAKLDADIVGLLEMENLASDAPVMDLVAGLNAALGSAVYKAILTGTMGVELTRVALIYKQAVVSPFNAFQTLNSTIKSTFLSEIGRNRPSLIQTFSSANGTKKLTVAVNHFAPRSAVCAGAGSDDVDTLDGQDHCARTRQAAAIALAEYLNTDPTASGDTDYLIVGNLNAFAKEDAIAELTSRGFVDLNNPSTSYSFIFDGRHGYLDHALVSASLFPQVTNATIWHINADEINLFDYNDDVQTAGEGTSERKSNALPLFANDPYRSSNHDPVLVGFNLT